MSLRVLPVNAACETAEAGSQMLDTVAFLCGRGAFGYAALDTDYRALWRYGDLAGWIPLGVNICGHTHLFFGLEKDLLDLQDEDGACMTLPRVGIPSSGQDSSKISVETFWDDRASVYHVVIHRLVAESEVELELLKQIRARRLAEDNFQLTRETLARKQMLLDVVMDHLPVAAAVFDDKRRYLFATRHWARHFRMECEPFIGKPLAQAGPAFSGPEQARFEAGMVGHSLGEMAGEREPGAAEGDGGHRWRHKGWAYPEEAQNGVLSVVEDVSDIAADNIRLRRLNERLLSSNRQLAGFASVMAHDMRAPLRALWAVLDREARPEAGAEERIAAVVRHVGRLSAMLHGMDDYLKALCFEPVLRPVKLRSLAETILAALPNGASFSLDLRLCREEIDINPGMLDLVLRNLLDNAVKHHDRGGGRLVVSLDEDETGWRIGVEDDGPGLPAPDAAFLNGHAARGEGAGPGLGLQIVKRAVEGVGGTVQAFSTMPAHRGTKVDVRWPKDRTKFVQA